MKDLSPLLDYVPASVKTAISSAGLGLAVAFLGDADAVWQKFGLGGIAGACAFVLATLIRNRPQWIEAQINKDKNAALLVTQQHKDIIEQLNANNLVQVTFLKNCIVDERKRAEQAEARVEAIRHSKHALANEVNRVNLRIQLVEALCLDHQITLPLGSTSPIDMMLVFREEEEKVNKTLPAVVSPS